MIFPRAGIGGYRESYRELFARSMDFFFFRLLDLFWRQKDDPFHLSGHWNSKKNLPVPVQVPLFARRVLQSYEATNSIDETARAIINCASVFVSPHKSEGEAEDLVQPIALVQVLSFAIFRKQLFRHFRDSFTINFYNHRKPPPIHCGTLRCLAVRTEFTGTSSQIPVQLQ